MLKLLGILIISAGLSSNPPVENPKNEVPVAKVQLEGIVIDHDSQEPIPGAKIEIEGLEMDLFTDFDGKFSIPEIDPGSYNIQASFISYRNTNLNDTDISTSNQSLIITLKP
jgi:hypothetical protein